MASWKTPAKNLVNRRNGSQKTQPAKEKMHRLRSRFCMAEEVGEVLGGRKILQRSLPSAAFQETVRHSRFRLKRVKLGRSQIVANPSSLGLTGQAKLRRSLVPTSPETLFRLMPSFF